VSGRSATSILIVALLLALLPGSAAAHDDPVLTVRVLCDGITNGQIDQAMGELDDNASILVDRPVRGREQIIAWIQQQLVLNLRIEVVDVQPQQVGDGYEVTWTTRMYREDWRKAGVPVRQTTEHATIHNGRITQWTSSLASTLVNGGGGAQAASAASSRAQAASAAAPRAATADDRSFGPSIGGVPLSRVPIGLVGLAAMVVLGVGWFGLSSLRRPRQAPVERRPTIEALAPGAADRKR
jgi:hypothetical protein